MIQNRTGSTNANAVMAVWPAGSPEAQQKRQKSNIVKHPPWCQAISVASGKKVPEENVLVAGQGKDRTCPDILETIEWRAGRRDLSLSGKGRLGSVPRSRVHLELDRTSDPR
jgi:hypothetical protein